MPPLLSGKSTLTPDLPLFERISVISVISVSQMPLPLWREVAVLQFPCAPSVILTQTLFPQRAAPAVLLIRLIEPPVQPAGAAAQGIQPQLFSCRADIGILLSVIGKGIPFQLYVGTVVGGLGPDKERDSLLLQHPVSQRRNTFRTVGFRRRSRLIVL